MKKNNTKNILVKAGVFVGVLAAGTVGYLLFGPQGKKNRKKIEDWLDSAKTEIIEQAKLLRTATREEFSDIIDAVLAQYTSAKHITLQDSLQLKDELLENWESLAVLFVKGKYKDVEIILADTFKQQARSTLKKITNNLLHGESLEKETVKKKKD